MVALCAPHCHLRLVLRFLFLLAATASGFLLGSSSTSVHHRAFVSNMDTSNRPTKRVTTGSCSSSSDQTTRTTSCLAAGMAANGENKRKNIFHDYDGPIVLMGCSSTPGNELLRLAESFSAAQTEGSEIVQLSSENKDSLLESVSDKRYTWPDILLLDLSADEVEESIVQDVAKSLYNDINVLSIFVNVDSASLTESQAEAKSRMEESVFVEFSDYELCIRDEGLESSTASENNNWEHIEWELTRLLARARLIAALPGDKTTRSVNSAHLTMGENTFFLSLSFPEISRVEPYVEPMCQDVDAMEYRTDLLKCRDSRFDLLYGMQLLRRYCRPHTIRVPALALEGLVLEDVMPIVYTVRTASQAGTYPDDEDGIAKMFEMLEWGLRGGVEVLDVESAWDTAKTTDLLDHAEERYSSQILGSHHVVGKEVSTEDAVALFEQCALNGRAHGAKVVLSIDSDEKDRMAYEAALIASELAASAGDPVIPMISLILGEVGQFSRIINLPFTPVTHEALPFVAAPGQLTSSEIMATRLLTKIFAPKKYAILGHNIAYSVSPQMHGAAFAATKLPNEYVRVDVATVEEFVESDMFKSDDFGGTSVTIPHKQTIMPYVDVMSEAAETIGSVNTLIAKFEFVGDDFKRVVYGDNTDWRGIFNPLDRLLGGRVDSSNDYALILGAGGTARAAAYVAKKLGLKRIYFNRTPEKAELLAQAFGGTVVSNLDQDSLNGEKSLGSVLQASIDSRVRVVISTLPAASEFVLPQWLLADDLERKPIIFDVNYKPYFTALLRQAEAAKCNVVRGSEMLWEQGVGQFELWTGRTAPYSVMKNVVLQNCRETNSEKVEESTEVVAGAFE